MNLVRLLHLQHGLTTRNDYTCYCLVGNGEYNPNNLDRVGTMEYDFELLSEWEELMAEYEENINE
jgi:hypothetical protein